MTLQRLYRHFLPMMILALLCSWIPGAALAKAPLTVAFPAPAKSTLAAHTNASLPHAVVATPAKTNTTAAASAPARTHSLGTLPLAFVGNAGQSDAAVRFMVRGHGGTLFFTSAEAVLAVPILDDTSTILPLLGASQHSPLVRDLTLVRLRYQGANPALDLRAGAQLPGVVNYLLGDNPNQWYTNLPTYDGVSYAQLYRGIDLSYAGVDGQLKRTYQVAPGADPSSIRWRYTGATDVHLDTASGAMVITLPAATLGAPGASLTEQAPIAWQDQGGQRVPVTARYDLAANGSVGFVLGAYDSTQPLTIDPVLTYSTFLGGSGADDGTAIAVDGAGNTYVTGGTYSSNFPTAGPLQGSRAGNQDVFVSKLSADGSTLLYSTYLGGSGNDEGNAIALDSAGNIALTGKTESTNFPKTSNAVESTFGGGTICAGGVACSDAFVAKLQANGSALIYSTYLGGTGVEEGTGVAVDTTGNLYATGIISSSANFSLKNAFDTSYNGVMDAFVIKLNPTGSTGANSLLYSTYLGGGADDEGNAIVVDATGKIYVVGETDSSGATHFPTSIHSKARMLAAPTPS